jgi:DNA-binding FadR family transcriptional regulator
VETATGEIISIARQSPPGTRLGTKEDLRAQCGVSVGTFNEALALAQIRGYISLRPGPGGGVFVAERSAAVRLGNSILALDAEDPAVGDAIRVRDALDPLLIADAVRVASLDDVSKMRRHLAEMRAAIDSGKHLAFVRENWALHRTIAESSPSSLVRSIYLGVLEILEERAVGLSAADDDELPGYIESRFNLHADIVDAIEERDATRAQELIRHHNLST